jgi:hypothetical protein
MNATITIEIINDSDNSNPDELSIYANKLKGHVIFMFKNPERRISVRFHEIESAINTIKELKK